MTAPPAHAPRHPAPVLVAWLLGTPAAIAGLKAAGRGATAVGSLTEPRTWAGAHDAVTIAFEVLRLLTLGLAWYLLAVMLIGSLARAARWQPVVVAADAVTVPAVRHLLQSALGVGLATAVLAVGPSPTQAAPRPPAMLMAEASRTAAAARPAEAARPSRAAPVEVPVPTRTTWTAATGDHLWSIAADVLADAWDRAPTDSETVSYWEDLVNANRRRLADPENPDLIYPGQTFQLPPLPDRPRGS